MIEKKKVKITEIDSLMIQKFGNRVNWVPRGDINKIGKQYDERDWIDMIYNNESDEIYNII